MTYNVSSLLNYMSKKGHGEDTLTLRADIYPFKFNNIWNRGLQMGFVWFLVGLFVGGIIGFVVMACLRMEKVEEYENELMKLERELKNKK